MILTNLFKALSLGGIMLATPGYCGQKLNAVWSSSSFGAIGPPGGSGSNGYSEGFNLLTEDGEVVFSSKYPGGYSACGNSNDSHGQAGRTFRLSGGCFAEGGEFEFHCYSESLNPDHCKVFNKDWITLAEAKGNTNTNFIGIAIGIDGYCGTSFELSDGVQCGADASGWVVTPNA